VSAFNASADVHAAPTLARGVAAPGPLRPLVRFEVRRFLRHPALIAGVVLGVVLTVASQGVPTLHYLAHTLLAVVPIGLGAMLAAFLTASRVHRDDAGELLGSLPVPGSTRSAAQLVAGVAPVVPAMLLVAFAAVAVRGWDGFTVATPEGIVLRLPSPAEGAAAFAGVLACAAIGALLGRLLPFLAVVPVLALFGMVQVIAVTWSVTWPVRWLFPFVNPAVPGGWVQVTPGSGYDIVVGWVGAQLVVHVAYALALVAFAASAVLVREDRSRRAMAAVLVSGAVVVVLGVLQVGVSS
jgi:hypothetical protein